MRNRVLRATLALVVALAFGANAMAAIDKTVSVSATASISGVTTLGISPASIVFGNTATDAYPTTPADQKVTITYSSNYSPWKIAIYTNNTQVPDYGVDVDGDGNQDGRYAKGGLATADGKAVAACKWVAKGPGNAPPAASTINQGGKEDTGYNFIKDKRDEDDPETTLPHEKEDWDFSFGGGYANVAWGLGDSETQVCVDPTVYYVEGDKRNYIGDTISGSFDVYIAGLFGTGGMTSPVPASAGNYASSIYFDLYHE